MGTGNYSHPQGTTVMIDLFDGIDLCDENGFEDYGMYDINCDDARIDLHECINDCLTDTWRKDGKSWRRDSRDCLIIAENDYHQVWTHEDSHGNVFVTYGVAERVSDRLAAIAEHTFADRAERFFDRLQEHFPKHTYVATSAWTSAPRERRSA